MVKAFKIVSGNGTEYLVVGEDCVDALGAYTEVATQELHEDYVGPSSIEELNVGVIVSSRTKELG